MCLSAKQYQMIYFVIVRQDDILEVVRNRIMRIEDWHTNYNAFPDTLNIRTIHQFR